MDILTCTWSGSDAAERQQWRKEGGDQEAGKGHWRTLPGRRRKEEQRGREAPAVDKGRHWSPTGILIRDVGFDSDRRQNGGDSRQDRTGGRIGGASQEV